MKKNDHLICNAKRNHEPNPLNKHTKTRLSFALLSLAFTFISAWNGFHFYLITFGLSLAILITATFEIARFTCLFRFIQSGKKTGILAVSLYLITASVCAFASINSFNAGVIRKNQSNDRTIQKQIFQIKESYAQKMAKEIEKISQDAHYLGNMTIKYPGNGYWQRRLAQTIAQKDNLITERDRFLAINPPDPQQWITMQAAILGLKLGDLSEKNEDVAAVNMALKELWGLDQVKAQKIIGIGVTATVELSILLLAMLATRSKRPENAVEDTLDITELLDRSAGGQGEEVIENFIKASQESLRKTGKLPPQNKITRNLRPLGRLLKGYDLETIRKQFLPQESKKENSTGDQLP